MSGATPLFLSSSFNLNKSRITNPIKQQQSLNCFSFTSQTSAVTKTPTPPWVKRDSTFIEIEPTQQQQQQQQLIVPTKPSTKTNDKSDRVLTDKISGGRGKKAMKLILLGIDKLHKKSNISQSKLQEDELTDKIGHFQFRGMLLEDIISVNNSHDEEVNTKTSKRMPWTKDEKMVFRRVKKEKLPTKAELSLDKMLLERLRRKAPRIRNWVKVKKIGVSHAVVDQIHFIWSTNELAMVKFDLPLCRNMDRAHEIVELKTGGLVVWSKKDTLVAYRGHGYQYHSKTFSEVYRCSADRQESPSSIFHEPKVANNIEFPGVSSSEDVSDEKSMKDGEEKEFWPYSGIFIDDIEGSEPINGSLYEREADRLLDGLGPRFVDWWRPKPLPVDADKLPEVVPGYKLPYRLAPLNGTSKLTAAELTYLRKDAQHLPTHFVLGRNRMLQGLASTILKLWEKSHIVKIAIKWGIMNTSNEEMAFELKRLTGGVLLLRNKFFIILYRGKDFLPCGAADLIAERDTKLKTQYLHEEDARLKAAESLRVTIQKEEHTGSVGTLSEFQNIQTEFEDQKTGCRGDTIHLEAEKENVERELKTQEHKLFILQAKIERSARELSKLNSKWSPSQNETDQELITQEEKECLRKIAMKRTSTLVLGRRGVFDGVMEAIYQHWKHREVVKVITMQKTFTQVIHTAKFLEAESGGILISIEKLKEGHAIIIYRGKNFTRPSKFTTNNLLTKRKALQRSLELQRIGSLKYIAYQRQLGIFDMKLKIEDINNRIEAVSEGFTLLNFQHRM